MKRTILGIAAIWLGIGAGAGFAHPALYHYLEINLHEPGTVRIYVTLHAPELSDSVAPLEEDVFGADWLASRSDEVIAELVANGHRFAAEKFDFTIADRESKVAFTFPPAMEIRHPPADTEVPAGCFSGVGELSYSVDEQLLTLVFSASAEKRLMLVINRPAAFPEVFDLEPGRQNQITLPLAPVEEEKNETKHEDRMDSPDDNATGTNSTPKSPILRLGPLLLVLFAVIGFASWRFFRR